MSKPSTPQRPTKPAGAGSGIINIPGTGNSVLTQLTTASVLSPFLKSKGGSRFGIGHFVFDDDKIVFEKKRFPVTTEHKYIKILFEIGKKASSEAVGNFFILPKNIVDQFQKYIDYLISGVVVAKTPSSTGSYSLPSVSSGSPSPSNSSRSPSPPHSPTWDIDQYNDFAISLDVDLSVRSEVLQSFIKKTASLFKGYEEKMHKLIELSSDCKDKKIADISLIKVLIARIISESEVLLARFYNIFKDSSSQFEVEIGKLKGKNEGSAKSRLGEEGYKLKLSRLENDFGNFNSANGAIDDILGSKKTLLLSDLGSISLLGKELELRKGLNDNRFCSYDLEISEDGFVSPCFTIEGGSRRPEIINKKGEIVQTQGDHTTAYTLLLQAFLNSVPSLSRYEDLPKKIEALLVLSFEDSEKEEWESSGIAKKFADHLISDKQRREFIKSFALEKEDKDFLNNIIKLYQVEICCEIICSMADKYLFISNQNKNATVALKPGAVQVSGGEGALIKNFSEAALYYSLKGSLDLVQEELKVLVRGERHKNLTKLEAVLSKSFSSSFKKTPTICSGKNNAEIAMSETLSGLIDLSSLQEAVSDPLLDVKLFEDVLRNYFLRHFRISSSAISCALDGIDKMEKGKGYKYKDSFNSIVSRFFDFFSKRNEFLRKYVDDIRVSIVDENGVLNLDSTDPLSKAVIKTDFTSFLENILRNAVKIYRDNLTIKDIGGFNFISPLASKKAGCVFSSPSLVSPKAIMPFTTPAPYPARAVSSLDVFNYVRPKSNLTHQNIDYLLKEAFTSEIFGSDAIDLLLYDKLVSIGAISVAVIDVIGDSLDYYLRDNVLKFIAGGHDRTSIALCRGRVEDGEIRGNTHWTALHLRRVKLDDDSYRIDAYYTDSLGGEIPSAVIRVLGSMNSIVDISFGDDDLKRRILLELRKLDSFNRYVIPVSRQEDGWSCGYHAVLALKKMHQVDDILSFGEMVSKEEVVPFIDKAREVLQSYFNKKVDEAVVDRFVGVDKIEQLQMEIYKIIANEDLDYLEKFENLIKIQKSFIEDKALERGYIKAGLKLINFELIYQRIVVDFVENLRCFLEEEHHDIIDNFDVFSKELLEFNYDEDPLILLSLLRKISSNLEEFFLSLRDGSADSKYEIIKHASRYLSDYSQPIFDLARKKDKTLIFVLIDSKMSYEKSIIADKVGEDKIFECRGKAGYKRAVDAIKREIDAIKREILTQTEEFNLHLILFAHGKGDRIMSLGEDLLPENIFKEFDGVSGLTVSSVVSCGAGFEVEKISSLNGVQIMISRAGKRETLRANDILRIIDVVESEGVVPRLLKKVDSKIILLPPETIKIIAQKGVYKFSPFDIFKESEALSKEKIFEEIKRQQISLMQLFGSSKDEIEELEAFKIDDLESEEMEKYLLDLAFLVVATKEDKKVKYLDDLFRLGVRAEGQRIFAEMESQHLIAEVCLSGNIEMFKLLLKRNPDLIEFSTKSGKNLLMMACIGGKIDFFDYLVFNKGFNIEDKDNEGNNIFHHIIASGNMDLLNFILSKASEEFIAKKLCENNNNHRRPFDEAAAVSNLELMEKALELEIGFDNDLVIGRKLLIAANNKGLDKLVNYFIENNICLDEGNEGSNILHLLAKGTSQKDLDLALKRISKDIELASTLLKENNDDEKTPLDIAIECGNRYMIDLFERAATPRSFVAAHSSAATHGVAPAMLP